MLHELWSSVFRDYVDQQSPMPSLGRKRPSLIACITEQTPSTHRQHNVINLTSLISYEESKLEREGCLPNKGWLVILELIFSNPDGGSGAHKFQQKKKFGYVESFRCYRRTKEHGNPHISQLESIPRFVKHKFV